MRDTSKGSSFATWRMTVCLGLWLVGALPASAQQSVEIKSPKGSYGTEISGTITGHEYVDYVVHARKGQHMTVSLRIDGTNGHGTAYFNILPAGKDYDGLFTGHMATERKASVTIPHDGGWAIRVYLMGNDKDAGKTVGYLVDVAIK